MATTARRKGPTMADAKRAASAVEAAAGEGLAQVLLYGSVARGQQHEHSDIDLLVVFGDMDYATRRTVQRQLSEAASTAVGQECNVRATDMPEWTRRKNEVSSSFERAISADAICLTSNGRGPINWEKTMVKPMSNEQEALREVKDEMAHTLRDIRDRAFVPSGEERDIQCDADEQEAGRLNRMRKVCYHSSMLIEQSLKALAVLQGEHPEPKKQRKSIGHSIGRALEQIHQPHQDSIKEAIRRSGITAEAISKWREQSTYPDDIDLLSEEADEDVDIYIHLSLDIAWTVAEEVSLQIEEDKENVIGRFRRLLDNVATSFKTTEVRTCTPLKETPTGRNPGPIPISSPVFSTEVEKTGEARDDDTDLQEFNEYLAAVQPQQPRTAACSKWMRIARKRCVLTEGHRGPHRSTR